MELFKLIAGFSLVAIFAWLIYRTRNAKGVLNNIFKFDMIVGIVAGIYLIVSSVGSILG